MIHKDRPFRLILLTHLILPSLCKPAAYHSHALIEHGLPSRTKALKNLCEKAVARDILENPESSTVASGLDNLPESCKTPSAIRVINAALLRRINNASQTLPLQITPENNASQTLPLQIAPKNNVRSLHFSPNGHYLLLAGPDNFRCFDPQTNRLIWAEKIPHVGPFGDFPLGDDHFFTIDEKNKRFTVHIFDMHTGEFKHSLIPGHTHEKLYDIQISPNHGHILTTTDNKAYLYDILTSACIHSFEKPPHGTYKRCRFNPDRQLILLEVEPNNNDTNEWHVFDTTTGAFIYSIQKNDDFNKDFAGNLVAIKTTDTEIKILHALTGTCIRTFTFPGDAVNHHALFATGHLVIQNNRSLDIFNVTTGTLRSSFPLNDADNTCKWPVIKISKDGNLCLLHSLALKKTYVINPETGQPILIINESIGPRLSDNGKLLSVRIRSGGIHFYSMPSGTLMKQKIYYKIIKAAFNRDANFIATLSRGGRVRIWRVDYDNDLKLLAALDIDAPKTNAVVETDRVDYTTDLKLSAALDTNDPKPNAVVETYFDDCYAQEIIPFLLKAAKNDWLRGKQHRIATEDKARFTALCKLFPYMQDERLFMRTRTAASSCSMNVQAKRS